MELNSLPNPPPLLVRDLMKTTVVVIDQDSACKDAAELLASHSLGRLPVVSAAQPKKIVGIISRSDLLKARLHNLKEETLREAPAYSNRRQAMKGQWNIRK